MIYCHYLCCRRAYRECNFPVTCEVNLQFSAAFLFPALIYRNFAFGLWGMLLSILFTIVLKILLKGFEETARLMGPVEHIDNN